MRRYVLAAVAALAAAAAAAAPLVAQQRDTTLTREQRIRERLRTLGPLVRVDTARTDTTAAGDTLGGPPQQVRIEPSQPTEGLTGMQRDSVMSALLRIAGYVATEYKGDTASFDADSARLDLKGAAEVIREGTRLAADTSIIYYERTAYACAYGNPVVSGAGVDSPIRSDSLCYDIQRGMGMARGARTEVSQGAVWYVSGDLVTVGDNVYTHDAVFTDCALEEPHYHFGAGEMKVIRNNVMVARNVTLRFADVPVFWLPFFVQSLSQGRRSGLLFPRFGVNDIARNSARYSRRIEDVGFYLAISDHLGAEMALDWQSENWTSLRGSFDYRFTRQFFEGAATFRRFWRVEGRRDFTLATNNSWQPDERTRLTLNGTYATSVDFVRTRSLDPRELNQTISSTMGVTRRFDWGNLSVSADRNQYLSDNSVVLVLPSVNLGLSSMTLFPAQPGEERWFNNMTWTASGSSRLERRDISETEARATLQDTRNLTASANSSFSLGKFSWTQGFNLAQRIASARGFGVDTIPDLPGAEERRADWSTQLSYQQRLIGTSSLTPGLRMSGQLLRDSLDGSMVAGPTRIDFNSSLNTDLFGFFPGFGPFQAIRHRLSPSINYSYSPEPTVDARQRRLFAIGELREQNRISLGFTQTFEAKYEDGRGPQPRQQRQRRILGPDSLPQRGDTLAAADTLPAEPEDTAGGPRRRETAQKLTLLSISTDALVYDFVSAREDGEGIQTLTIGNNLQSDLLRGLQLSFAHDLFRRLPPFQGRFDPPPTSGLPPRYRPPTTPSRQTTLPQGEREFAPHLSNVNASFTVNSDSWIARLLRLSPRDAAEETVDTAAERRQREELERSAGPAIDRTQSEMGLLGTRRRVPDTAPSAPVGQWDASLSYSLSRPRDDAGFSENQMLTGSFRLQATENWGLSWNTGYSFTRGEFTDHALTLTRRLHDFDANFDFFKAQNGNFSFQFRVHLRANPELKLDYEQRDLPGVDQIRR